MPELTKEAPPASWATRIAVLIGAVVVSLVIAEFGLRLVAPQYADDFDHPPMFMPDPKLGHRLIPNASFTNRTAHLNYTMNIDALGLRDHGSPPATADTTDILAIGDSYTFGHGANAKDTYAAQLEQRMRDAGVDARVFNGGVCGYSTIQEFAWLQELQPKVRPDVVIFQIFLGNDIRDNWIFTHHPERLSYAKGALLNMIKSLLRDSHVYLLLRKVKLQLSAKDARASYAGNDEAQLALTERVFSDVIAFGKQAELPSVFLVLPARPTQRDEHYARYRQWTTDFFARSDTLFLDLTDSLEPERFYLADGHFTPEGNALISEHLQAFLSEKQLLGTPARRR